MLKTEKIETSKSYFPIISISATLSLILLCSSAYIHTRPCMQDRCKEISHARELAENSDKILSQPQLGSDILLANQQLTKARKLLSSISRFSKHYSEADNLLETYQFKQESLQKLLTALETGAKAASALEIPPDFVSELHEGKILWQEAIAIWKQVLTDKNFTSFAQSKIQEYQKNLAYIEEQLKALAKATINLKAAKEAANAAITAQSNAESFSNWQQVYAYWETSVKLLKDIPNKTNSYEEAQALLEICQVRLIVAQERKNLEEAAVKTYDRAINIAQQAKKSESNGEWLKAVSHWRNAIFHLKKIPKNTFQYRQIPALITSYTQALTLVQSQLHATLRVKQARIDLEKICSGDRRICNYTFNDEVIKIQLTPPYSRQIWDTALEAQEQGNLRNQVDLLDHIHSLEQSFKTITNNVGIPLEIYNSERVLILTYAPKQ